MYVQVSRDPFVRTTLMRKLEARPNNGCDYCGAFRVHKGAITWKLFRYFTVTDGGRCHYHKGLFCSKECHDAYHS